MHGSRSTGGTLTTRGSHVVSVTAPSLPLEEETVWKQPAIKGLQERNTPLDAESKVRFHSAASATFLALNECLPRRSLQHCSDRPTGRCCGDVKQNAQSGRGREGK